MSAPVHPAQALAVYAEPLVAKRRVVVFGEAATGLAARIEELGAEAVLLVTPEDDLGALRGARFDLALVADLGQFDDPEETLGRIRRSVGDGGVALIAAVNRAAVGPEVTGAFDYYDLFDLVAREFADVRMIAQMPFHGVALAEMGEGESPAVSVDTQLVDGGHAPQAFVALASQHGASLDPYAIIELPPPARVAPRDEAAASAARAELSHERTRVQALSAQVETLESRVARSVEHERDLGERVRQLAELSTEVEEMRAAAEAGRIAAAQVEDLARRADRAERTLARIEPELARAGEAHSTELARFEEALRERALIIRQLEVELARRERMVLDLVGTLDERGLATESAGEAALLVVEVPVAPPAEVSVDRRVELALVDENARLRERLDALALELARREGEAQAGAWTIAELERRLERPAPRREPGTNAPEGTEGSSGAEAQRLAAALDELDALRKALVQEHEARARAESAAVIPAGADQPVSDVG